MEPLTMITMALVAGAATAAKGVAAQAVKDAYAGLKALILRRAGEKADVEDAIESVEKRPESEGRKSVLQEELEVAKVDQDAEVVQHAKALLELLEARGQAPATYHAEVRGSGAVAQGPGATAAGEGATVIQGNGNVIGNHSSSRVQHGGISANRIEAENVVDGVQMRGGTPDDAAALVDLAQAIQHGGITADEIKAGSVVSGLQFLTGAPPETPDELREEVAALREQVEQSVANDEIPSAGDAEDVTDALEKAEAELAQPDPDGARVVRKLKTASEILTGAAETAQGARKVGWQVIKLAPLAAALWQLAQTIF